MTPEEREHLIGILQSGEEIDPVWQDVIFPTLQRECRLSYKGKEREEDILADTMAVPLQPIRTFGRNGVEWHNKLIFGDNLQVLKYLLELKKEGKLRNADGTDGVRLVYIDPPFGSMQDFKGSREQKAYQDRVAGAEFIEFLRKRLVLLHELLAPGAAFYLHLDNRRAQYAKVILDELFGDHNFRNAIVWKRSDAHSDIAQGATHFGRLYDTILYYVNGAGAKLNPIYTPLPQSTIDKWYRHEETAPDGTVRRYNMGDTSGPGGGKKGNPYFEWKGIKRYWRFSPQTMADLEAQNLLAYSSSGIAYLKRYLDESKGVPLQDWWDDISMLRGIHQNGEGSDYPTQKPEQLLDRIIRSSSNEGDLVLDAFAGSGTTLAVAEKLNRRWIGIDCGKLAIYTTQKRLLNLKAEIGNKGEPLKLTPMTLYNAGLYDFTKLRELPWRDWKLFALQLFGCRSEPHEVGGLALDGFLRRADVLVFNHLDQPGAKVTYDTIDDIHQSIGGKVGSQFFIIAPALCFGFQEDFVTRDDTRYFALRIPYSIINELHRKDFTAIRQPLDEATVNDTVDAVGFDFIRTPDAKVSFVRHKPEDELFEVLTITVESFFSEVVSKRAEPFENLKSLAMLLIDSNYDGEVFNLTYFFYADELNDNEYVVSMPTEVLGDRVMLVLVDIYGNEFRQVVAKADLEFAAESQKSGARVKTKKKRKKAAAVKKEKADAKAPKPKKLTAELTDGAVEAKPTKAKSKKKAGVEPDAAED